MIEITLTRPGEEPMTTNMKIQQSDLDLMRELQDMAKISKYLWKKRLHMLKYSYEKYENLYVRKDAHMLGKRLDYQVEENKIHFSLKKRRHF